MKINKCEKESFVVIGKEGSTKDGEGFNCFHWIQLFLTLDRTLVSFAFHKIREMQFLHYLQNHKSILLQYSHH